jgi:hypothetical protein
VTETGLTKKIRTALERRGCKVYKYHGGAFSAVGFPDLIVIRPDGITAFVEIKLPGKKPTKIQYATIDRIGRQGAPAGWADSVKKAMEIVWPN